MSASKAYPVPRYRLGGQEFEADPTYRGLAFANEHQPLVETIVDIIQEACRWFYEQDPPRMVGVPDAKPLTDTQIDDRLRRYDLGENRHEPQRAFKNEERRYHLLELPRDRKRACIEQIDALLAREGFEWIGNPARVRIRACPLCRATIHTPRIADGRHWWAGMCRGHPKLPILVWRYHWLPRGRVLLAMRRKFELLFPEHKAGESFVSGEGHPRIHAVE